MRNDSQEGNIERQSKYMATAKAIEDLEDHEKTSESKLPTQAAKGRGQTTKGAGKHPKGKAEQANQKPHKTRSQEISMKKTYQRQGKTIAKKKQKPNARTPMTKNQQPTSDDQEGQTKSQYHEATAHKRDHQPSGERWKTETYLSKRREQDRQSKDAE